ncbi:MAG: hypothetical protein V4597_11700 [Pseudomonadota bacterium]
MTAEEWVQGLDLPNLLRHAGQAQIKGLIITAIREAVLAEREACATMVAPKSRLVPERAFLENLAAAIRGRPAP